MKNSLRGFFCAPAKKLASAQLEELDYRKLYEAYSTKGRKSAADARVMFEVICYGYQCGIYSNRDLEEACRYTFVWRGRVEKNLAKVKRAVNEGVGLIDKQKLREYLAEKGIAFVHGTGKRKSAEQKEYEQLAQYLERWEKYEEQACSVSGEYYNGRRDYAEDVPLYSGGGCVWPYEARFWLSAFLFHREAKYMHGVILSGDGIQPKKAVNETEQKAREDAFIHNQNNVNLEKCRISRFRPHQNGGACVSMPEM